MYVTIIIITILILAAVLFVYNRNKTKSPSGPQADEKPPVAPSPPPPAPAPSPPPPAPAPSPPSRCKGEIDPAFGEGSCNKCEPGYVKQKVEFGTDLCYQAYTCNNGTPKEHPLNVPGQRLGPDAPIPVPEENCVRCNNGYKLEGGKCLKTADPPAPSPPSRPEFDQRAPIIKGQRCLKGQKFLGFDKNVDSCNAAASGESACKDMYWVQTGDRGRCYCATFPGTQMNMSNTPCFGGSGWQQNDQYDVYRIRR